jgi:hypothetical protein
MAAKRKAPAKPKPKKKKAAPRKAAASKAEIGRPSGYDPEFVGQAQKLCALGATDGDVADFFGVSSRTIYRWKAAHPAFCHALKTGKDECDERVERSLYHRAVGYTYDAVKIFNASGTPMIVPHKEHVPPDTTAAIFWLKNRRPDAWRDVSRQEHTGKNGGPIDLRDADHVDQARRVAFALGRVLERQKAKAIEAVSNDGA